MSKQEYDTVMTPAPICPYCGLEMPDHWIDECYCEGCGKACYVGRYTRYTTWKMENLKKEESP